MSLTSVVFFVLIAFLVAAMAMLALCLVSLALGLRRLTAAISQLGAGIEERAGWCRQIEVERPCTSPDPGPGPGAPGEPRP